MNDYRVVVKVPDSTVPFCSSPVVHSLCITIIQEFLYFSVIVTFSWVSLRSLFLRDSSLLHALPQLSAMVSLAFLKGMGTQ